MFGIIASKEILCVGGPWFSFLTTSVSVVLTQNSYWPWETDLSTFAEIGSHSKVRRQCKPSWPHRLKNRDRTTKLRKFSWRQPWKTQVNTIRMTTTQAPPPNNRHLPQCDLKRKQRKSLVLKAAYLRMYGHCMRGLLGRIGIGLACWLSWLWVHYRRCGRMVGWSAWNSQALLFDGVCLSFLFNRIWSSGENTSQNAMFYITVYAAVSTTFFHHIHRKSDNLEDRGTGWGTVELPFTSSQELIPLNRNFC